MATALILKPMLRAFFVMALGFPAWAYAEYEDKSEGEEAQSHALVHVYSSFFGASPAIALSEFDSNWAEAGHGTHAQASTRLGVELKFNNSWAFGVENRLDYLLHFSNASAQFYKQLENEGLSAGDYPLQLSINALASDSIFAQYFIPLSINSSLSIKSYFVQPNRVQYGYLNGVGQVSAAGATSYSYDLDYQYKENELSELEGESVKGWGHSFDIEYDVSFNHGWHFLAKWQDVFHKVYWSSINQDQGCLSRPVNAQCFVKTSLHKETQSLQVHSQLLLETPNESGVSGYMLASQWARYDSLVVGARMLGVSAGVDLITDAIHLAYESDMVRLKLASDQVQFTQSKYLQVSVDIYWPIL